MSVAIVTCTGGRPELLALCSRWVAGQDLDGARWITSDDSSRPMGKGTDAQKAHSHLAHALSLVPAGHHVVIMEDDDWYPPNYVRTLAELLDTGCHLAGAAHEIRYNLPARRYEVWKPEFPNAGSTAIHADSIADYRKIIVGEHGSDHIAWKKLGGKTTEATMRVSIKGVGFGLPGRKGASAKKHDPKHHKVKSWKHDPDCSKLREWIGDDADAYLELLR